MASHLVYLWKRPGGSHGSRKNGYPIAPSSLSDETIKLIFFIRLQVKTDSSLLSRKSEVRIQNAVFAYGCICEMDATNIKYINILVVF